MDRYVRQETEAQKPVCYKSGMRGKKLRSKLLSAPNQVDCSKIEGYFF